MICFEWAGSGSFLSIIESELEPLIWRRVMTLHPFGDDLLSSWLPSEESENIDNNESIW